jgi:hypothetical protein
MNRTRVFLERQGWQNAVERTMNEERELRQREQVLLSARLTARCPGRSARVVGLVQQARLRE